MALAFTIALFLAAYLTGMLTIIVYRRAPEAAPASGPATVTDEEWRAFFSGSAVKPVRRSLASRILSRA